MKILILNSGSSSIKFQLRDAVSETVCCKGLVENIGEPGSAVHVTANGRKLDRKMEMPNHTVALNQTINLLTSPELQAIESLSDIKAVGHRVVHGGEDYSDSVLITDHVVEVIDRLSSLAPLHNPPNLKGILACREILPGVPQVAVFDTSFHQSMPPVAYMYALPREFYDKYKVRRYGFHGTSHLYVHGRARKLAGLDGKPCKIITAHLGNGCSITAVKDGKVIDTSMGFTPLEGLVMGTRSGDFDASLTFFLNDELERANGSVNTKAFRDIFQKKSGLLGLSGGLSNNMKVLLDQYETNPNARLAVDVFCYRLKKYIGSYAAALGGLDVLVFTAGIGENAPAIREKSCEGLRFMGLEFDAARNKDARGKETLISTDASRVKVYMIPTDEELVIAEETIRLVNSAKAN